MNNIEVSKIIDPIPASDGAGVKLKRSIGVEPNYFDPFLMLDEFGSENSEDYIAGFPPHPHSASYIVLATLSAPLIFDLISQAQLVAALELGNLPSNVAATINLFGGDPLIAMREMPLEMKQLIRQEMLPPELLTGMLLSSHQ